jgi:hypothetical protein
MTSTTETPTRWRKKPLVITAIQFTGANVGEIWEVFGTAGIYGPAEKNPDHLILTTVHGDPAPARAGDWVIPDAAPGTFYPCKPEVFAATYEPAAQQDDVTTRLLALQLPENASGATTVRGYLIAILAAVWRETEGFSGKRPFGNSSWQCDLYAPMIKAGFVPGTLDEDGYLDGYFDEAPADALILAAIERLGQPS